MTVAAAPVPSRARAPITKLRRPNVRLYMALTGVLAVAVSLGRGFAVRAEDRTGFDRDRGDHDVAHHQQGCG